MRVKINIALRKRSLSPVRLVLEDSSKRSFMLFVLVSLQLGSIIKSIMKVELELDLIQNQMTQKPMLREEVYARTLRASRNRKKDSVWRAGSIILPPPFKV